ncbi:LINE-1 retrotransposable element ORF2 protein [Chlorella vulgaris]
MQRMKAGTCRQQTTEGVHSELAVERGVEWLVAGLVAGRAVVGWEEEGTVAADGVEEELAVVGRLVVGLEVAGTAVVGWDEEGETVAVGGEQEGMAAVGWLVAGLEVAVREASLKGLQLRTFASAWNRRHVRCPRPPLKTRRRQRHPAPTNSPITCITFVPTSLFASLHLTCMKFMTAKPAATVTEMGGGAPAPQPDSSAGQELAAALQRNLLHEMQIISLHNELTAVKHDNVKLRQQLHATNTAGMSNSDRICALEKQVQELLAASLQHSDMHDSISKLHSRQEELVQRQKVDECQHSLVLKTESALPAQGITAHVQDLLCQQLNIAVTVLKVQPLGNKQHSVSDSQNRKHAYKVGLGSSGQRTEVLRIKAQALRGTPLSIDALLTPDQLASKQRLMPVARQAKTAGQSVRWRYGTLLINGKPYTGPGSLPTPVEQQQQQQQQQQVPTNASDGYQTVQRRQRKHTQQHQPAHGSKKSLFPATHQQKDGLAVKPAPNAHPKPPPPANGSSKQPAAAPKKAAAADAAYLPPYRSKYGLKSPAEVEEYITLLGDEVAQASACPAGADVLLAGDMNAHTGSLPDVADHSKLLHAALHEEAALDLAPCTAQGSAFAPPPRISTCTAAVCEQGKALLQLCCITGMLIANGRVHGDVPASTTCYSGQSSSVVDYMAASPSLLSQAAELQVLPEIPEYRGHRALSLELVPSPAPQRSTAKHADPESEGFGPPPTFAAPLRLTPDRLSSFAAELKQPAKAEQLRRLTEEASRDPLLAATQLHAILYGTAAAVFPPTNAAPRQAAGSTSGQLRRRHQPWFDEECAATRRQIRLQMQASLNSGQPSHLAKEALRIISNRYTRLRKRKAGAWQRQQGSSLLQLQRTDARKFFKQWQREHPKSPIDAATWLRHFVNLQLKRTFQPTASLTATSNPATSHPTAAIPSCSPPTATVSPSSSHPTTAVPATSNPTISRPTTASSSSTPSAATVPSSSQPITALPATNPATSHSTPRSTASSELDSDISVADVHAALDKLSSSSACLGPLKAVLIKAGRDALTPVLAALFNAVFRSGCFPPEWSLGAITPIHKKGDTADPNNYRGITVGHILGKLYALAINTRLNTWLETQGLRARGQAGFRQGYRTVDNCFILRALAERARSRGVKLYLCAVDFEKAFDSVDRPLLWAALQRAGIGGTMLQAIQAMYADVPVCVRTEEGLSGCFQSVLGVKQGCPLSPLLFGIFLDDFEGHIQQLGDTAALPQLAGHTVPPLLFADDMFLLSSSASGLQAQLHALQDYCNAKKLTVNAKKTQVMIMRPGGGSGNGKLAAGESFAYAGLPLEVASSTKYLGLTFSQLSKQHGFASCADVLAKAGRQAMFAMRRRAWELGACLVEQQCMLFDVFVKPVLSYGCELPFGYSSWYASGTACRTARRTKTECSGTLEWLTELDEAAVIERAAAAYLRKCLEPKTRPLPKTPAQDPPPPAASCTNKFAYYMHHIRPNLPLCQPAPHLYEVYDSQARTALSRFRTSCHDLRIEQLAVERGVEWLVAGLVAGRAVVGWEEEGTVAADGVEEELAVVGRLVVGLEVAGTAVVGWDEEGETVAQCMLFDVFVKPVLSYGCELWGVNVLLRPDCSSVERVHRWFCRRVQGLPKQVTAAISLAELGRQPLQSFWIQQLVRFWNRLQNSAADEDRVLGWAFKDNLELMREGGDLAAGSACWSRRWLHVLQSAPPASGTLEWLTELDEAAVIERAAAAYLRKCLEPKTRPLPKTPAQDPPPPAASCTNKLAYYMHHIRPNLPLCQPAPHFSELAVERGVEWLVAGLVAGRAVVGWEEEGTVAADGVEEELAVVGRLVVGLEVAGTAVVGWDEEGETVAQCMLFDVFVKPVLSYGCELWGVDVLLRPDCSSVERVHRWFCRRVQGLPKQVTAAISLAELGRQPLQSFWIQQLVRFWNRLQNSAADEDRVLGWAFKDNLELMREGGDLAAGSACWSRRWLHVLQSAPPASGTLEWLTELDEAAVIERAAAAYLRKCLEPKTRPLPKTPAQDPPPPAASCTNKLAYYMHHIRPNLPLCQPAPHFSELAVERGVEWLVAGLVAGRAVVGWEEEGTVAADGVEEELAVVGRLVVGLEVAGTAVVGWDEEGETVAQCMLFDVFVKPVLSYGCELWGVDVLLRPDCSSVERVHRWFCRRVQGLPKQVTAAISLAELGRQPLQSFWIQQLVRFWNRLQNSAADEDRVLGWAFKDNLELMREGGDLAAGSACWSRRWLHVLQSAPPASGTLEWLTELDEAAVIERAAAAYLRKCLEPKTRPLPKTPAQDPPPPAASCTNKLAYYMHHIRPNLPLCQPAPHLYEVYDSQARTALSRFRTRLEVAVREAVG